MSEEKTAEAEVTSQLTIDATVNKEDIVNMHVAQAELTIKTRQEELRLKIQDLKSAIKSAHNALKMALLDQHLAYFKDEIATLKEAYKKVFKDDLDIDHSIERDKNGRRIALVMNACGESLSKPLKAKDRISLEKLDEQVAKAEAAVQQANEEMLDLRRQEKHLPSLERQLRGQLARKAVEKAGGDIRQLTEDLGLVSIPGITCLTQK